MTNLKQKSDNAKSVTKEKIIIPPLIAGDYFKLLIGAKGQKARKELIAWLNGFYPAEPLLFRSWKNRFLYPTRGISQDVLNIMEEGLNFYLRKFKESINEEVKESIELIDKINSATKIYDNE